MCLRLLSTSIALLMNVADFINATVVIVILAFVGAMSFAITIFACLTLIATTVGGIFTLPSAVANVVVGSVALVSTPIRGRIIATLAAALVRSITLIATVSSLITSLGTITRLAATVILLAIRRCFGRSFISSLAVALLRTVARVSITPYIIITPSAAV